MAGVDGYARDQISHLEFRVEQLEEKLENIIAALKRALGDE